ncbi:MAG: hypothetical protein IBX40_13090 [Methanosarcinales archaeon]|nr:hypothetical protein [Methanosarcinales archaeon]
MKNKISKCIIASILFITCITTASAIPPIPESYWGYASINGIPTSNDTSITVEIYGTGEEVGNTTVQFPNGGYSLDIIFDDSDTSYDEGADEGNALIWKLGGVVCDTPTNDVATSGKVNNDFNLVCGDDPASDQGSLSDMSVREDIATGISDEVSRDEQPVEPSRGLDYPETADQMESSGEVPSDKNPAIPGFSFIEGIFFLLAAILLLRIN